MGLNSNLSPTHFPRRWSSLWPHTNLSPWPCRRSLPSSSVIRGVRVPSACKTSIYLDSSSNDLHANCRSLDLVDHSLNFQFQYFLSLFTYICIYVYMYIYIYVYIQYVCIYIYMYLHNISTLFLESRQLILFAPFPRPKTAAPRSPLPRPPPVRPLRKRVKPASPGSAKTTRWMWSGVTTRQSFTTFFACKNFDTLLESYSKFYLTIDNWNHILHILTIEYSIYSIYSIYFT